MVKWQCRHRNLARFSGKSTSWRCVQAVIVPLLFGRGWSVRALSPMSQTPLAPARSLSRRAVLGGADHGGGAGMDAPRIEQDEVSACRSGAGLVLLFELRVDPEKLLALVPHPDQTTKTGILLLQKRV